jgi:hypothetical protein
MTMTSTTPHLRLVQSNEDDTNVAGRIFSLSEAQKLAMLDAIEELRSLVEADEVVGFALCTLYPDGQDTGSMFTEACFELPSTTIAAIDLMGMRFKRAVLIEE